MPTRLARSMRHVMGRSAKLMERATAVDHTFRPFSRSSQAQRRSEDGRHAMDMQVRTDAVRASADARDVRRARVGPRAAAARVHTAAPAAARLAV